MTTGHEPGTCSWCGLPVASSWFGSRRATVSEAASAGAVPSPSTVEPSEDEFCCFGCRFASQVTQDRGESGHVQWTLTRLGIAIFCTMNVMVFTMALWSQDVYDVDRSQALVASLSELFRWLCFVSATPVLFLLGIPIAVAAGAELSRGRITTDLLVVLGVVAAFAYSVVSLLAGNGHVYFEVASMVLVLVTLGRWLEARGKLQTGELLESLERLIPATSRLLLASSEVETPTADLKPGDRVRVLAGERIPADGVLESETEISGETVGDDRSFRVAIDQQILTGESDPVTRRSGEEVVSGTVPVDSSIVVRVTRPSHEGALSQILDAVRRARAQRGRFQTAADRTAAWFVPFVALVAVATFVGNALTGSFADGVLTSLAVTLIACPCALGLATSVAVWTAMRHAAERGILFRSGEVLERLSAVKAVRFDKTGTLTSGRPSVSSFICDEKSNQNQVATVADLICRESTHSFSKAIASYLSAAACAGQELSETNWQPVQNAPESTDRSSDDGIEMLSRVRIQDVRTVSGLGLEAVLKNSAGVSGETVVWLGSQRFLETNRCRLSSELQESLEVARREDQSTVLIGWDHLVRGVFTLQEDIREEAALAVDACRELGLDLGILSGDLAVHAKRLGHALEIPASGELLPDDKLKILNAVQRDTGPVLMVGDGINDGPAMAGADVAASLGGGTDLSRDAAGVCLLRDDLSGVPWVIGLARQTRRVIRQNLFWAFGYNTVGMALAVAGLLNPVFAAGLMFGSSAFVLWNSQRLRDFELPTNSKRTVSAISPPAVTQRTESVSQSVSETAGKVVGEAVGT
ncbi:MAG: cation-translocating P-type ATPase [Rhodopirellula sp.]|nr:cation-translocating P-type ATPase [Rhodopirellula sp.]